MSKKHHEKEEPSAPQAPTAPAEAAPASAAPAQAAEAEIASLKGQAEEWKDKCLRVAADLDNYRKRMAREKADLTKYSSQHLLTRLLPIIDNFEMALQHAEADSSKADAAKQLVDGLKMTLNQLHSLLRDAGVEAVNADGQEFNPQFHEAVSHLESEEHAAGAVIQQLRKGYRLHDRLLRPAAVVVSKGKPSQAPAGSSTTNS
jgi:molecular chaperone GrpE